MATDHGMPSRRNADDIQRELERLRRDRPHDYARASARLLHELERLKNARPRYALT